MSKPRSAIADKTLLYGFSLIIAAGCSNPSKDCLFRHFLISLPELSSEESLVQHHSPVTNSPPIHSVASPTSLLTNLQQHRLSTQTSNMTYRVMRLLQFVCILLLWICLPKEAGAFRSLSLRFPHRGGHQTTNLSRTSPSSSRLHASVQFKNVEAMLDNFRDEPVLIAFTAINCGPCKLQKKELVTVQKDLSKLITMVAIDTDRWPSVGSKFQVGKLPCLVALRNGQVLLRMEGLRTAEEITSSLRVALLQEQEESEEATGS